MTTSLRLAFREEGEFWNAYIASTDTMAGSFLIGSIRMAAVRRGSKAKLAFMDAMKASMAAAIKEMGVDVTGWSDPVDAPSHERTGRPV